MIKAALETQADLRKEVDAAEMETIKRQDALFMWVKRHPCAYRQEQTLVRATTATCWRSRKETKTSIQRVRDPRGRSGKKRDTPT